MKKILIILLFLVYKQSDCQDTTIFQSDVILFGEIHDQVGNSEQMNLILEFSYIDSIGNLLIEEQPSFVFALEECIRQDNDLSLIHI